MRLRHVHLNVGDVEAAKTWYMRHLDLDLVHEVPGALAILDSGSDVQLGLEAGPPVSEPERVHVIFRVDDVDAVAKSLTGVEMVREPADEPYGHRVAIIRDCVGHTVELYTPLDGSRPYD